MNEDMLWVKSAIQYIEELDFSLAAFIQNNERPEIHSLIKCYQERGKDPTLLIPIFISMITQSGNNTFLTTLQSLKDSMPTNIKNSYSYNLENIVAKLKNGPINDLFLQDTFIRENNHSETPLTKELATRIRHSCAEILYPRAYSILKSLTNSPAHMNSIATEQPALLAAYNTKNTSSGLKDLFIKALNNQPTLLTVTQYFGYNSDSLSQFIDQLSTKPYVLLFDNHPEYLVAMVELCHSLGIRLESLDSHTPGQILTLIKVNLAINNTMDHMVDRFRRKKVGYEFIPSIIDQKQNYKKTVLTSLNDSFKQTSSPSKIQQALLHHSYQDAEQQFCQAVFPMNTENHKMARMTMAVLTNTITHLTLIGLCINMHHYLKTGTWFLFSQRASEVKFRQASRTITQTSPLNTRHGLAGRR